MQKSIKDACEELDTQVVANIEGRGDLTRADLWAEFSRVSNTENWKLPIDATVELKTALDVAVMAKAIVFFTASVPTFMPADKPRHFRVIASGYYAAIGA